MVPVESVHIIPAGQEFGAFGSQRMIELFIRLHWPAGRQLTLSAMESTPCGVMCAQHTCPGKPSESQLAALSHGILRPLQESLCPWQVYIYALKRPVRQQS